MKEKKLTFKVRKGLVMQDIVYKTRDYEAVVVR